MMKHSLIAIAAPTAVGSACAESSVSLYGIVDTAYQFSSTVLRIDPNAGISTRTEIQKSGLVSGVLSGSRWGLKGEEELGNGLSAVFNVEAGFDSTTGTFTNGFNRRSVVGIKSNLGTVVVGRDNTPLDNWGFDIDGNTKGDVAYTDLYSGVFYSGEFSGIGINAMIGGSRTKTGTTNLHETGYGLGLNYSSGAFSVGGALQQFRERDGAGIKHTRTEYGLAASYDFGPAKLFSHYMASKHSIPGGGVFSKWEHANIGVSVPVSDSLTLMAEYGRNRATAQNDTTRLIDIYGPAAEGLGLATGYRLNGNGNNFMAGANYALSKRTDLYARVGRSNSLKARVYDDTPPNAYLGQIKGHTNYIQFGIRHTF